MIYLSLPCFYQNLYFNNFFKNYVLKNKEKLKINFVIEYVYGAFPWSTWNGGYNSTNFKNVMYQDMEKILSLSNSAIRIDCANCCLDATDYYDRHQNIILDLIKDTSNIIDISDIGLLEYLQNKYPNLEYAFSNNAEIFNKFSIDIINTFLERPDCLLITLNDLKDIDINNINNIRKCELIIGKFCSKCNKEQQLKCIYNENQNQIAFSGSSVYYNCKNSNFNIDYISEIKNNKQISHFKIATPTNLLDLDSFNRNLIMNFIKPEYQFECLSMYYGEKNNEQQR